MKIKQTLQEGNKRTEASLSDIMKECRDYIDNVNPSVPLYRGTKRYMGHSVEKRGIHTERQPKDMSPNYVKFFNLLFERKFGIKDVRNRSTFATSGYRIAQGYGEPFWFFPMDNSLYVVIPTSDSLHMYNHRILIEDYLGFHKAIFGKYDREIYLKLYDRLGDEVTTALEDWNVVAKFNHYYRESKDKFCEAISRKDIGHIINYYHKTSPILKQSIRKYIVGDYISKPHIEEIIEAIKDVTIEVYNKNIETIISNMAEWFFEGVLVTKSFSKVIAKTGGLREMNELMILAPYYYLVNPNTVEISEDGSFPTIEDLIDFLK